MKKIITAITFMFIFSASYSQGFHLGIKAGANMNKITGIPFSQEFTYGYNAGVFADIGLGTKWAIHPEVLFNQTNVDTSSRFSSVYKFNNITDIKLNYLTIPLLLEYKLSNAFALQAGPQFGILLNSQNTLVQNGQNAFKQGDVSLVGGVQLKLLGLNLFGRYIASLNNINNLN